MSNAIMSRMADKLSSAQNRIKLAREKAELVTGRVVTATVTVAGGAASGALNGVWGKPEDGGIAKFPGTKLDADLAGGTLILLAGITDMAGKESDKAIAFGSGMVAAAVSRVTHKAVDEHERQKQ